MAEAETAAQPAPRLAEAPLPVISLVVPVFNEEGTLEEVCRRSLATLDGLGKPYELIIYANDDHAVSGNAVDRNRRIVEWFRKHMR